MICANIFAFFLADFVLSTWAPIRSHGHAALTDIAITDTLQRETNARNAVKKGEKVTKMGGVI